MDHRNTIGTSYTRNITDLAGNLAAILDQAGTAHLADKQPSRRHHRHRHEHGP
jgi:hypothetical protein